MRARRDCDDAADGGTTFPGRSRPSVGGLRSQNRSIRRAARKHGAVVIGRVWPGGNIWRLPNS